MTCRGRPAFADSHNALSTVRKTEQLCLVTFTFTGCSFLTFDFHAELSVRKRLSYFVFTIVRTP
jgi:hypothetical protein